MGKLPFEAINRKLLLKREEETSPKFGKSPERRSTEELLLSGIVNIDKPRGPTSHQVSDFLQKIIGVGKAGHSGTLDPQVSGVLPIAYGKATRVVQGLLTAGKEYVALMHVHKPLEEEKIRAVADSFIGKIRQMPPIKSSVKRQERTREIYYLEILEIDGQDVLFACGTEAGTYIRKLIHDMGQKMGCGANMQELRRTKVGPFDESSLVSLQDLSDAIFYYRQEKNDKALRRYLLPLEAAVLHLPKMTVIDTAVDTICHGASLKVPGVASLHSAIRHDDDCALLTLKGELIAIAKAKMGSDEIMKSEKGIAASDVKVFMQPGTYPRIEHEAV